MWRNNAYVLILDNYQAFILRLFGLYYKLIYICIEKQQAERRHGFIAMRTAVMAIDEIRILPCPLPSAGAAERGGDNKHE